MRKRTRILPVGMHCRPSRCTDVSTITFPVTGRDDYVTVQLAVIGHRHKQVICRSVTYSRATLLN